MKNQFLAHEGFVFINETEYGFTSKAKPFMLNSDQGTNKYKSNLLDPKFRFAFWQVLIFIFHVTEEIRHLCRKFK